MSAPRPLRRPFPRCARLAGGLFAAVLGSTLVTAQTPPSPAAAEVLQYSWRLEGFGGRMARLFLPGSGSGTLTTGPGPHGTLQSELLITSEASDDGEFWRYGAEIDPATQATLRAWSSYRYHGKAKTKEQSVATPGAVDVSAAIHLLRNAPPKRPLALQIWSEGKLYPVRVVPGILERVRRGDRDVLVRRYVVEGVEEPGQRYWKGRMELALAVEGDHVPVEIVLRVSLASVRLRLVDAPFEEAPAS